eukprot:gene20508-22526_t
MDIPDDSHRIVFNIGGTRHETHIGTLKAVSSTRLAWIAENHQMLMGSSFYDNVKQEYFFDRHPTCFASILQYYRTGKLHYPLDVCGPLFHEELLFWGIDETQLEDCCWEPYTAHRDKLEKLIGFKGPHFDEEEEPVVGDTKVKRLKNVVWSFLDDPYSSRAASINGKIATFLLLLYVLIPVLYSMSHFKRTNSPQRAAILVLEVFTNAYFTLEFILRVICCPDKKSFVKSKMNWVDFLSLWSFYIDIAVTDAKARRYTGLFAVFRIVKIFRTFRYNYALQVLVNTLKESLPELMLLVFLLVILAMAFAFCNYHLEDDDSLFYNIPSSLWWSLITMTTVGYGDMYPTSWAGKFVGIACAVCGLLMVALPVSVVATNFSVYYSYAKARIKLPPKRKVKPGVFSTALNLVSTPAETPTAKRNDRVANGNKVAPLNGVQVPAHHANGNLPPIRNPPGGSDGLTMGQKRWAEAVGLMKQKGMVKKKVDLATLVSVFGSKGAWPGAKG